MKKSLLGADCSCVVILGMSSAQKCGVVSSAKLAISEWSSS